MQTYDSIARAIRDRNIATAYLLWGEEPLFIDKLSGLFASQVIPADERDFNQTLFHGNDRDLDAQTIIAEAMRFPMLGEKLLVLVREAQQVKDLDLLAPYLTQLPESTCLVLCYKGKVDKRKALYKAFDTLGTHYESSRISDGKVPDFIIKSFAGRRIQIDAHTAQIMAEHTGNDLEKILSEVDKLSIVLGERGGQITPEFIETHVGISKEYNNFELLNALIRRNAAQAFRIAHYFAQNERTYPIQMTLPILFNYFAQLMAVHYLPDKSERSIASQLGIAPYMAGSYAQGAQAYSARAVFAIVRQLRLSDAASKGIGSSLSGGEILRELIAFILATR